MKSYSSNSLQFLSFLFVVILFLASCSKKINPNAPVESYPESSNKKQESTIAVPIEIPISGVQNQLNKELKGNLFELKNLSATKNDKFNLTVAKQSDITLKATNNTLNISIPLAVSLDGEFKVSALGVSVSESINSDFSIKVNLTSKLSLAKNWQVQTDTQIKSHQWLKKPTIKVLGLELPLDFIADVLLNKSRDLIAQQIDKEIPKQVDLKTPLSDAWKDVQKPVLVSEGYDAYLQIEPLSIGMEALKLTNNQLKTAVGIQVFAETHIGGKPETPKITALPNYETVSNLDNTFSVILQNEISRDFANQEIRKQFIGQTFTYGKKNNKIVTITNLYLYGSEGKMVVQVDVIGNIKGALYFSGNPVYDEEKQAIVINDLDFGIDTKNVLLKTASWIFEGKIEQKIAENLELPIQSPVQKVKQDIQNTLKDYPLNEFASVEGDLQTLRLGGIRITKENIIVDILAEGELNLNIKDF